MTHRRGTILLLVLVVVSILSLVAMTFAELMRSEYQATRLHGRQVQARAATYSGWVARSPYPSV